MLQQNTAHDALLKQHKPLVIRLAKILAWKLPTSHFVKLDDLIQAGMIGLSDALTRYDETNGVKLETFINHRIKGAMIDELRNHDTVTRSERRAMKRAEAAILTLQHQLVRNPSESEISTRLKFKLDDYQKLVAISKIVHVPLDNTGSIGVRIDNDAAISSAAHHDSDVPAELVDNLDPLNQLLELEIKDQQQAKFEKLPERERFVLEMLVERKTLAEIGELLGVTESRACQFKHAALNRLNSKDMNGKALNRLNSKDMNGKDNVVLADHLTRLLQKAQLTDVDAAIYEEAFGRLDWRERKILTKVKQIDVTLSYSEMSKLISEHLCMTVKYTQTLIARAIAKLKVDILKEPQAEEQSLPKHRPRPHLQRHGAMQ